MRRGGRLAASFLRWIWTGARNSRRGADGKAELSSSARMLFNQGCHRVNLNEVIPNITREEEFVLCHARTAMSGPARARIDRLILSALDWKRIDALAALHRIRPLLFAHLKIDQMRPAIPAVIWKDIE